MPGSARQEWAKSRPVRHHGKDQPGAGRAGGRYGPVLPAEGHLLDLLEPEDVVSAWKRWTVTLLRPDGLYGTKPVKEGNKAAKLRAIRDAPCTARRVWLATDCDRERQLIGQEILEHFGYKGEVRRVMFTAQDLQTIRDAFAPSPTPALLSCASACSPQPELAPAPHEARKNQSPVSADTG